MEFENAFFNTADFRIQPEKLGNGSYGTVYAAENINTGQKYAAKIINIEGNFDGREQMLFFRESLTLNKLNHPAIVKFIGINFKSFIKHNILQPTIITEYLPNGSLKDNLNKEENSLSDHEWNATKKYINLLGISDALRYLHEQGVLHRDLKTENILVDSNYYPKVCDFGLSKCFPDSLTNSMKLTITGKFGTPIYSPPEILREETKYDSSVDVYAFGMIAYEIVTGKVPFSELGDKITLYQLTDKIINGYRPKLDSYIPKKMQDLISRCWSDKPKDRPTFNEIFEELSTDFSYFNETIDEDEIQDYLFMLNETRKESKMKRKNHLSSDENPKLELNELKVKISPNKNEHSISSRSNHLLYSGIVSLISNAKEGDIKKSVIELKKSSEEGNNQASLILGLLYEKGEKVEQNIKEAFKYYELSFNQGNPKGFSRIGRCFEFGKQVKQDYFKAIEYYEKAAELGDEDALNRLGIIYDKGYGVEKNYTKAIEYYKKAEEFGDVDSLFSLGYAYDKGNGVDKKYTKAIEYYERAAEFGNVDALFKLGFHYHSGSGVEKNKIKAIEYYERAAELGDSDSLYNLGLIHSYNKNYSKALECHTKAAELGCAKAFYNLGNVYQSGNIIEKDILKSIEFFEKAGELGIAEAFSRIGNIYKSYGSDVDKDYSKAIEYYEKAAEHGYIYALIEIANLYSDKSWSRYDEQKSQQYYTRAFELENK